VASSYGNSNDPSSCIKGGEFLDLLSDQLLKDSAPCTEKSLLLFRNERALPPVSAFLIASLITGSTFGGVKIMNLHLIFLDSLPYFF
jgi:hypothetical protein